MSALKQIKVISQNIVGGKTDGDEEMLFEEALPMLINRFGYSTHQTQDVLSALLTNGKVRIHYKEIWQRLRLKNPAEIMKAEEAEKLVNEMIAETAPGPIRITIPQAVAPDSFTICVAIKKPTQWKDLIVGDKINGYYEAEDGKKITVHAAIVEIGHKSEYHRARTDNRLWLVANPETKSVGSSNYFYLLADTGEKIS